MENSPQAKVILIKGKSFRMHGPVSKVKYHFLNGVEHSIDPRDKVYFLGMFDKFRLVDFSSTESGEHAVRKIQPLSYRKVEKYMAKSAPASTLLGERVRATAEKEAQAKKAHLVRLQKQGTDAAVELAKASVDIVEANRQANKEKVAAVAEKFSAKAEKKPKAKKEKRPKDSN